MSDSRIQFLPSNDPRIKEFVAGYGKGKWSQVDWTVDYHPELPIGSLEEDANTFLRDVLKAARKEGIAFRFWCATIDASYRNWIMISFKDMAACEAFDVVLEAKERTLSLS